MYATLQYHVKQRYAAQQEETHVYNLIYKLSSNVAWTEINVEFVRLINHTQK